MTHHVVVGVYDAEADAAAAVRDLEGANVPADAISQHTKANFGGTDFESANAITHKRGFWGRLFNTTGDEDSSSYNRSIERGSTVITVAVSEEDVERVSAILESHSPIAVEQESSEDLASEASGADAEIAQTDDTPRVRRYVVETLEVETEPQRKSTP
jgi:hypothetical protein